LLKPDLTLLVSDLHLTARRPDTTQLFERFLAGPARAARALYILGDLFDYWLGDDSLAEPFNRRICHALCAFVESGCTGYFMAGNRDFLVGEQFATATGLHLLAEPTVCQIGGVATLLLHGDTLCTDDADYQGFRATVRSPDWSREFLAKPLAERRRQVEGLRERSETEKRTKPGGLMDANAIAVADAFRRHAVTRMVHGHTHRQARHDLTIDGKPCQRWVLGQWDERGNALACDAGGCRWLTIPE